MSSVVLVETRHVVRQRRGFVILVLVGNVGHIYLSTILGLRDSPMWRQALAFRDCESNLMLPSATAHNTQVAVLARAIKLS